MTMTATFAGERSFSQLLHQDFFNIAPGQSDLHDSSKIAEYSAAKIKLAREVMEAITERTDMFEMNSKGGFNTAGLSSAMKKIFTASLIIRHIPLSVMYAASGWMSSKNDTETNLKILTTKLRSDPKLSRGIMTYAAQLFHLIRNQNWLDAYDPLYLLLATLYIWFFDRVLGKPADLGAWVVLRLDREHSDVSRWVKGERILRPHITGIGVLNGEESVPRILKEAIRILDFEQGWRPFARVISDSLQRILSGLLP
ncbi:hypothetical protein N7466_005875 [Penicillium verhagenii]|uniref:uncharacterized protein n=1 Tax=Penicillium verhagenii TaxID=1562060 RepID=UPI0025454335|nr:uncharacterized protein N7466_005875 [Penicillium verhagenii]KAJ5930382.1 hypothetical protein N7466_005875 [Penicillium verhagenii]